MPKNLDDKFYDRADAFVSLANKQTSDVDRGKVSASMMYATARYNAFVSACNAVSSSDLAAGKDKILNYFVDQYRAMLSENLDDHIQNFGDYQGTDTKE